MRAIYLLLALALVHDSTASIFRNQDRPYNEGLNVQPLDYANLYQQQPQENMWQQSTDNTWSQNNDNTRQQTQENVWHRRPDSSSEESKERLNYDDTSTYPSSLRTGDRDWSSSLFPAAMDPGQQPLYGDVISWHGVEVAGGPNALINYKRGIERIFREAYKTMKHVSKDLRKKIHDAFETPSVVLREDLYLNATNLIKKYGYGVEEHVVKTDDGYYLTLFRIQPRAYKGKGQSQENRPQLYENESWLDNDIKTYSVRQSLETLQPDKEKQNLNEEKQNSNEKQQPNGYNNSSVVLFMHGLLGSADDWILTGPKKSLAFLLVDLGYDVWLGNVRGSKYSRRHASKHVSHTDFWRFSIDEIANHDVPAMIDYALETSNQRSLYYVGHSQGNTVFFAWASTHPNSRDKVRTMYALSPMVHMSNVRSPLLRMLNVNNPFYQNVRDQLGPGEFNPTREFTFMVGGNMCEKVIGCNHVCSNLYFITLGVDTAGINPALLPVIASHLPAGASTRQIKQYGQAVTSHEFRMYDYGADINRKIYGNRQPPKYNMTEVHVPVNLYFSEEDWLAHPNDVEKLQEELPDVREYYKVPEKHFSHMDFVFSEKAVYNVYEKIIDSIQKNERK